MNFVIATWKTLPLDTRQWLMLAVVIYAILIVVLAREKAPLETAVISWLFMATIAVSVSLWFLSYGTRHVDVGSNGGAPMATPLSREAQVQAAIGLYGGTVTPTVRRK